MSGREGASTLNMDIGETTGSTILDLSLVELKQREAAWQEVAPRLLPSLSVRFGRNMPPTGTLAYVPLGSGALWVVRSAPAAVEYHASRIVAEAPARIALCLQIEGSINISHDNREINLNEGDIAVIDERLNFTLFSPELSTIAIIQLPRELVFSIAPQIQNFIACPLRVENPGVPILNDMVASILRHCRNTPNYRKQKILSALINILSSCLADSHSAKHGRKPEERLSLALSHIDNYINCPGLDPESVANAQNVSRRRLDQIMIEMTGFSVAGYIWKRRLENSSIDLRDPANRLKSITTIAFENGFQDSAHFCRSFKKHFGSPPSVFRVQRTSLN